MKDAISTVLCCIMFFHIQAQHHLNNFPKANIEWKTFPTTERTKATHLAQNKTTLQLGADDELILQTTHDDQLGFRHYRYQQHYKGIPVEGAIYLMHEKDNKVEIANGNLVRQLNINTTPTIDETTALQVALQYVNATQYAWQNPSYERFLKQRKNDPDATFYPTGKLVVRKSTNVQEQSEYKLTYKFNIYTLNPLSGKDIYINAHDGSFVVGIENIHTCTDVSATGTSNYSDDIDFAACQNGGTYTLKNNLGGGMQVFNANNDNSLPQVPFTDSDTFFDDDLAANEVHWATEKTYQYFIETFDRNSLDGNGMPIDSWVHCGGNNAFWHPIEHFLCYGDGDNVSFTSFTSPDAVAHEMTHGVTTFSADLELQNESGALNESFSDIFAEVIENYIRGSNDWLIGADFTISSEINSLRNMTNPNDPNAKTQQPDTYLGDFWYSGSNDNIGVHTNSGVQNYWFYLLSEGGNGINDNGDAYTVNAIGMAKAAAVAYRNLTVYLTSTSEYEAARAGSIVAAQNLQSAGILTESDVEQVEAAWSAVGVEAEPEPNPCVENDSLALVALYNATNGPNWTNTWDLSQPIDSFYGVTLNEDRCLTKLVLPDNGLNGSIPSDLGNLDNLEWLVLNNNQLNGSIPSELGDLSYLTLLMLHSNQLTGSIPLVLTNLSNLESLYLAGNQLTGIIPPELGDLGNLKSLVLASNQLIGTIPIELSNLNNLVELRLGNNQLTGNIPTGIGNLSDLFHLDLRSNQLTGSIPIEFSNLANLMYLFLDANQLTGDIPPELTNLSNLEQLYLLSNQLSGIIPPELGDLGNLTILRLEKNLLTGSIPEELGNLSHLIHLYIGYNQLTGSIPVEISNLSNLVHLSIRYTYQISGSIPSELANLSNLTHLFLDANQLTGDIPTELANLSNLEQLYLGSNQLIGTIPPELGSLSNLVILKLDNNLLTGSIPEELGSLSNLKQLYLPSNQLTGNIPSVLGNLSNLEWLHLSVNQLSGNIPLELGSLSNLRGLYLHYNQLSGSVPSELGNLSNLTELYLSPNELNGCYDSNLLNLCSQLVTGTNAFMSDDNDFAAPWEDFCNNGTGTCNDNDPVWPGDFNDNGVASITDLLYWGLAEGNTGPSRPNASIDWTPQSAAEWGQQIDNINGKHQDGNGDGMVDIQDLQALIDNYGRTVYANISPIDTETPLQIETRLLNTTYTDENVELTYGLYVIPPSEDMVSAHGLAFSLDFSDLPFSTLQEYNIDTTGSPLQPSAALEVYDTDARRLDIALTRTDKNNRIINGAVVAEFIVVVSDLPTIEPYKIEALGGGVMPSTGLLNALGNATIYSSIAGQYGITTDFSVSISVSHEQCNLLGKAHVQAFDGAEPYTYLWNTGATTAEVTGLDSGLYTVTVTDAGGNSKSTTIQVNGSIPIYDTNGNVLCGSLCPDFLVPENGISDGLYKADNKLESSGIVPAGSTVDFKAGQTIELKKGFTIQSNADFSAEIEDCN